MSYCIDCGEYFRYDDCGGYNPPCACGAHCRSCHEDAEWGDDWCEVVEPVTGEVCSRENPGSHQSRICNGTCDSCDCLEWSDPAPRTSDAQPSEAKP